MKSVIVFLSIVGAFVFSSSNPEPLTKAQLQNNYLDALMSYEGTAYSTSGDRWGVSCSSLARKALSETSGVDAVFSAEVQSSACKSDQLAKAVMALYQKLLWTRISILWNTNKSRSAILPL
jgi:hypothetical protein